MKTSHQKNESQFNLNSNSNMNLLANKDSILERKFNVNRFSQSGTLLTWSARDEFIMNAENIKENAIKIVLNKYNLPFKI